MVKLGSTSDQSIVEGFMSGTKRAVVLLSGGLDSTTTLAIAKQEGHEVHALSFRYGQRHAIEIEAATQIALALGAASHRIIDIDLRAFGGSALTDDIDVPKDGTVEGEIPVTYVPARNTIFLSYALAYAEVLETGDIYIGVSAVDYSGYPDCRPEYIEAFERMANLATRSAVTGALSVKIHAPIISLTKRQTIERGTELGIDYSLTRSCYDPSAQGYACGRCDSCLLRRKAFAEASFADPTLYVSKGSADS